MWIFSCCGGIPLIYEMNTWWGSGLSTFRFLSITSLVAGAGLGCVRLQRIPIQFRLGLASLLVTFGQFVALRNAGLILFLFINALTWLIVAGWLVKQGALRFALVVLNLGLLGLGLGVFESALRVPTVSGSVTWHNEGKLNEADPELSYRLLPNAKARHWGIDEDKTLLFDVTYHTDANRSRRVPNRPSSGSRWLLAGGSFLFGHGLEDSETIPFWIQAARPDVQVFNLGQMGFGTADVYLQLRRFFSDGGTPSLIIYFLMDSHFWRITCSDPQLALGSGNKPCMQLVDGKLEFRGKASSKLTFLRRFNIYLLKQSGIWNRLAGRHSFDLTQTFPLMQALIIEMDRECRRLTGCKFLLVRLPRKEAVSEVGDLTPWKNDLSTHGIAIVDLKEQFDSFVMAKGLNRSNFFIPSDGHPNSRYTALMADWLLTYLRSSKP